MDVRPSCWRWKMGVREAGIGTWAGGYITIMGERVTGWRMRKKADMRHECPLLRGSRPAAWLKRRLDLSAGSARLVFNEDQWSKRFSAFSRFIQTRNCNPLSPVGLWRWHTQWMEQIISLTTRSLKFDRINGWGAFCSFRVFRTRDCGMLSAFFRPSGLETAILLHLWTCIA